LNDDLPSAAIRQRFAAAGQAERLAWLTKVAMGEVVPQGQALRSGK